MNRRQFLQRGAMAAVAVSVAPAAVLAPKVSGGGVFGGGGCCILHAGESILPRAKAEALGKLLQPSVSGGGTPVIYGATVTSAMHVWAAKVKDRRRPTA
jgi:hypothetical protein